jgi:hypothetical protein
MAAANNALFDDLICVRKQRWQNGEGVRGLEVAEDARPTEIVSPDRLKTPEICAQGFIPASAFTTGSGALRASKRRILNRV